MTARKKKSRREVKALGDRTLGGLPSFKSRTCWEMGLVKNEGDGGCLRVVREEWEKKVSALGIFEGDACARKPVAVGTADETVKRDVKNS